MNKKFGNIIASDLTFMKDSVRENFIDVWRLYLPSAISIPQDPIGSELSHLVGLWWYLLRAVRDNLVDSIKIYFLWARGFAAIWKQARIKIQIAFRLYELRSIAFHNNEPLSKASLRDLNVFLNRLWLAERPLIFLLDNGNLRALWKSANEQQVGLQFLGDGRVQYVIFAQRKSPTTVSELAGVGHIPEVRELIKVSGCNHLLFG